MQFGTPCTNDTGEVTLHDFITQLETGTYLKNQKEVVDSFVTFNNVDTR
jgi:hypothetical protein